MVKTKDRVDQILREYINILTKQFNIYAIVFFGSYVHGKPDEYSDIDLGVFSESFGKDPLGEMTLLCKMRRQVDTDIEPIPFSKGEFFNHSEKDFVHEILKTGKIIYKDGKVLI